MPTRLALRIELLALRAEDLRVRNELSKAGELEGGHYHPQMEAVHNRNAARMREIIAKYAWPTRTLVGVDGEEAAWLVVFHAISQPELQRRAIALLETAVAAGEAPAWQLACLWDRIASLEGRPQRYGTHCDWDDAGYHSIHNLGDPDHVDELRRSVGLGPLEHPSREGQTPMSHEKLSQYRARFEAWAKDIGWRK
jgi:hypothetical protein